MFVGVGPRVCRQHARHLSHSNPVFLIINLYALTLAVVVVQLEVLFVLVIDCVGAEA